LNSQFRDSNWRKECVIYAIFAIAFFTLPLSHQHQSGVGLPPFPAGGFAYSVSGFRLR
jgi:hypothetical protein